MLRKKWVVEAFVNLRVAKPARRQWVTLIREPHTLQAVPIGLYPLFGILFHTVQN